MNILLDEMPSAYEVGGISYSIDTSHITSIRVELMLEDPSLDVTRKPGIMLLNYFSAYRDGGELPSELVTVEAFEWCNWFLACGEDIKKAKRGPKKPRAFSFDDDSERIVADFQNEYGIDLTDRSHPLHWWRFMALFHGLSDSSQTMTAIGYRSADASKETSKERRQQIRAIQREIALKPRSPEEYKAVQDALWGV